MNRRAFFATLAAAVVGRKLLAEPEALATMRVDGTFLWEVAGDGKLRAWNLDQRAKYIRKQLKLAEFFKGPSYVYWERAPWWQRVFGREGRWRRP